MNDGYNKFDKLKAKDRRDVFEATADRLGATSQAIEKDLWVCRVIDTLFKGLGKRPKLFFKGGTSISKGYGLIHRFSEDIDIVLSRRGLRIGEDDDPLKSGLSQKKREAAAKRASEICSRHVLGLMKDRLTRLMPSCTIEEDTDDADRMSLRCRYPSIMPEDPYLKPWVKIECGARGAIEPDITRSIAPYIQGDLGRRWNLTTEKVTLIKAERTFWEKALILHGIYCGYRDDKNRKPSDKNLISRHYYDVAMMAESNEGKRAVADKELLKTVREHKQAMFRRGWEKLKEAKPGSVHLVPQTGIRRLIEHDYKAMQGMMFGDPPAFSWVIERLSKLEDAINKRPA